MKITAALTPEPPIIFQPVFREGCENYLEVFQKIFKENFSKDYRDALVKRANEKKDLKFRLIKKDEESIGILVYVKEPATCYAMFKWYYAFHVTTLHLTSNFNSALQAALILTAQRMEAFSILINVEKTNDQLKTNLLAHHFKRMEYGHKNFVDIFGYVVKKPAEIQQDDSKTQAMEKRGEAPTSKDVQDDRPEKKSKVDILLKAKDYFLDEDKR